MKNGPRFIQITAHEGSVEDALYALDEEGGVWYYQPERTNADTGRIKCASWFKLTSHRTDTTKRGK